MRRMWTRWTNRRRYGRPDQQAAVFARVLVGAGWAADEANALVTR
jgi:hypothetical protein